MPNEIGVSIVAQPLAPAELAKAKAAGQALGTAVANGTTAAQQSFQQFGQTITSSLSPLQKFSKALVLSEAREGTMGLRMLRTGLLEVAQSSLGASGPMAKFGEAALAFGATGPVVLGALAGLGALAFMVRALGADLREAQAAAVSAAAGVRKLQEAKGPNVAAAGTLVDTQKALGDAQEKLDDLRRQAAQVIVTRGGSMTTAGAENPELLEAITAQEAAVRDLQIQANAASDALHRTKEHLETAPKTPEEFRTSLHAASEALAEARLALEHVNDPLAKVIELTKVAQLVNEGYTHSEAARLAAIEHTTGALKDLEKAERDLAAFGAANAPSTATLMGVPLPHMPGAPVGFVTGETVSTGFGALPRPGAAGTGGTGGGAGPSPALEAASLLLGGRDRGLFSAFGRVASRSASSSPVTVLGGGPQGVLLPPNALTGLPTAPVPTLVPGSSTIGAPPSIGLGPLLSFAPLIAAPLEGLFSRFFGADGLGIKIAGYSPAALAQQREMQGAGVLVAVNSSGGADAATLSYDAARQSRGDGIVRIPVTTPGPGA